MAEARIEDEEESLRDSREPGTRRNARQNSPAERSERNKPEHRQSSQGALSSIRAAIKRTSTRTTFQSEQQHDRRRPEITILSAEPLASNPWFPGAPGGFPPPPPPAPPSWSSGCAASIQLPPPSYEQVLREKTREQILHSSSVQPPASSLLSTQRSTISTQTDAPPLGTLSAAHKPDAVGPGGCRPLKPPRPSLPPTYSPAATPTPPLPEQDEADRPRGTHSQTQTSTGRVEAGWDLLSSPLTDPWDGDLLGPAPLNASSTPTDPASSGIISPPTCPMREGPKRPKPRPRSKACLEPITKGDGSERSAKREVKVQTLVRLKDDGAESLFAGFTDSSEASSGKYLQELLDVFGPSDQVSLSNQGEGSEYSEASEEEEEQEEEEEEQVGGEGMTSQLTAVQSAESGVNSIITELSGPPKRPEPLPRAQKPKPALTPKPSTKENTTVGTTEEHIGPKETSTAPIPAPRPVLPKKPVLHAQSVPVGRQVGSPPLSQPIRPPAASRPMGLSPQTDGSSPGRQISAAPRRGSGDHHTSSSTEMTVPKLAPGFGTSCPPQPKERRRNSDSQATARVKPQLVTSSTEATRKSSKSPVCTQARPSPLAPPPAPPPAQRKPMPVSLPPAQAAVGPIRAGKVEAPSNSLALPLPPRLLPLRPPPIKLTKSKSSSPTPAAANQRQGLGAPKRGPPLPPRPQPGHPLFKIYSRKVSPGTAEPPEKSGGSAERSLQEEDILLFPEETQAQNVTPTDVHRSQCRPGDAKGRDQGLHKTVPPTEPADLSDWTSDQTNESAATEQQKEQLKEELTEPTGRCVARFRFQGEKDELSFSEGDVITLTQYVNKEWGLGQLSGRSGIFPLSFVEIVQDLSPPPGSLCLEPPGSSACVTRQGRALHDFTPEHDDELTLKVGDVVCALEDMDDEWFLGDFGGKRGLVPKNYVQVLQDP